jgi:hypothetical protein
MADRSLVETTDIYDTDSVTITRPLQEELHPASREVGTDCCFTWIKFKKLYPGDLTVRLTTDSGRTVTRIFTQHKTIRTGFIRQTGDDDDDDDKGVVVAVIGGLGRCIDVDVSLVDTSDCLLRIAHYHFRLCCNDPKVSKGKHLTHLEPPPAPGGQAVKLPLLEILDLRRDPCP